MNELLDFMLLREANTRYVVAGTMLLGLTAGMLGSFTVLRRRALLGDAIAHAVLPGVCLAFMFTGTKDPFILLVGALLSGGLATFFMDLVQRNTKLPADAVLALVLSVFFGIGIFLLTMIQQSGMAAQTGLDKFLFGQAASLLGRDVILFGLIGASVLFTLFIFFNPLKLISFDPAFASSVGFHVFRYDALLTALLVAAITAGIQAVGVVLMAALLVTPAVAARYWTEDLRVMMWLAGAFGALSGWLGALASYYIPGLPTGPCVVVAATFIFGTSMFFAPERGMIVRWLRHKQTKRRIMQENVLKTLYQLHEEIPEKQLFTLYDISEKRFFVPQELALCLRHLAKEGYVKQNKKGYFFQKKGWDEAMRITRLHRLWELYLAEHLAFPDDHVHADAEAMEHMITPELEEKLRQTLNHPLHDPHASPIPYNNPTGTIA
ncbi:MAG: metal ABC transporter permease [Bacteroidetes Order II. Incertae sedis bacterium]|nr:metal ABC transporter permease [Bacteroidetes Order II. bacterium]